MAGKIGYSTLNQFSLEAGASATITIPECSILFVNVGGGGSVYEIVKRFNEVSLVELLINVRYTISVEHVSTTQIKITNTSTSANLIRYKYIDLRY